MASGFNVIDFMDLSPVERCIVRLVLRETSMTYPELQDAIKTLPSDQQMDQATFNSALDHLTLSEWLISQAQNQQITYRVNTLQKMTNQGSGLLEGLDIEGGNKPGSFQLDLQTSSRPLTSTRGKRVLPTHIWDCLTEPSSDPVSEPPKRRASLFDKLIEDDDGGAKT